MSHFAPISLPLHYSHLFAVETTALYALRTLCELFNAQTNAIGRLQHDHRRHFRFEAVICDEETETNERSSDSDFHFRHCKVLSNAVPAVLVKYSVLINNNSKKNEQRNDRQKNDKHL